MIATLFGSIPSQKTPFLLDPYLSSEVAFAVAFRKLKTAHTYACKVRESGGNTLADIGFDANGYLDETALLAHCGSNNGFVHTWYDQSGNGNDVTNTTNGNQPKIVNAGSVLVKNSRPVINLDGTASQCLYNLSNPASLDITAAPLLINAVLDGSNTFTGYVVTKNASSSGTIQYGVLYDGNSTHPRCNFSLENSPRTLSADDSMVHNTQKIYSGKFTTGVQQGYINGSSSGTAGSFNGTLTSRANFVVGARSNAADGSSFATFLSGNIAEIIIMPLVTAQTIIEASQKSYLGIA